MRVSKKYEKILNNTGKSDSNGIQTHNHLVCKATINDFVYELSGCRFESCYCHLNFRYGAYFEQGVPCHSGKL